MGGRSTPARRCPATAALVAAVPDLEIAGFTVLGGRTHLPRHRGPMRSIRYQLGVRIPPGPGESGLRVGDEVVRWADAGSTAFDDRTEHEAWNDADEPRYVLFVQTSWPSRGLTGRLHRALRRGLWRLGGADLAARAASLDTALNGT